MIKYLIIQIAQWRVTMRLSFYLALSMSLSLLASFPEEVQGGKVGMEFFSYFIKGSKGPTMKFSFPKRQFCSGSVEREYSWNKGFAPKLKPEDEKISLVTETTDRKYFFDPRRSLYFFRVLKKDLTTAPMNPIKKDNAMAAFSKEKSLDQ